MLDQNYKASRGKHRGSLHDVVLGNDFLDMTLKAQATKAKLDRWDYLGLKNCAKDNQQSKK